MEINAKLSPTSKLSSVMIEDELRRSERGHIQSYTRVNFELIFENDPVWLLIMDKSFVQTITFPQFSSKEMLLSTLSFSAKTMYSKFLSTLLPNCICFGPQSSPDILLVSGSKKFCESTTFFQAPRLAIIDYSYRRRQMLKTEQGFNEVISHKQVGGPTNFKLSYYRSVELKPARRSMLRRHIDSFIDYSLWAKHEPQPSTFLTLKDTLLVDDLRTYVQIPSRFNNTQLGYRRLSHSELCNIFGIKTIHHSFVYPGAFQTLIPLQLLYALIVDNLQITPRTSERTPMLLPRPFQIHKKGFWLSSIARWLPEQWSPQYKAGNVAKNDDASVPLSLWDHRITKVFTNVSPNSCNILRKFLIKLYNRGLYLEVIRQLRDNLCQSASNEQRGGVF